MSLNVGIIGTGIFATDAHLPAIEALDETRPAAAFNRTRAKAEAFAEKANIPAELVFDTAEELLQSKHVDFVDALLPVQSNVEIIRKAIEHNMPIVVEKPIAANMEQAREIVEMARKTDLPIGILEQWAFRTAIKHIKTLLPKIGDVVSFTYLATGPWNDNNKYLATSWRQNPEHIGGFLSDGGVHQLALLTEILGPVEYVSGHTKQIRKESGADDILFLTFKMASGTIGTFTYGLAFGATDKATLLTIFATKGLLVYDFSPALPQPTITYRVGSSGQTASEPVNIDVGEVDAVQEEFRNFAHAVSTKNKKLVAVPPEKAFHHLAIVAAALESSKNNGSSVKVETI